MVKFMSAVAVAAALCLGSAFAGDEGKPAAEGLKDSAKVSVIGDNKTFHAAECRVIVKAKEEKKEVKEITVKEAKAADMKACKLCLDKGAKDEGKASKDEGKASKDEGKKASKDEGKKSAEDGKKVSKDEGKKSAEEGKKAKAEK